MTVIIFSLLVIFEIAFATYCINTDSEHRRVRSYAYLLELTIFLILCLLTILEWGMRWYLLGVLLLALAIKGIYVLTLSKKQAKQVRKKRIILKTIGKVLLYAIVLIPAFLFPQYEAPQRTGEFEVTTAQYTYESDTIKDYYTGGNRQVNVGFWYPDNAEGTYPLVVFSHGAFGIRDSNESAYVELASHGYVVCSIDHPSHSFYTKSEDGQVVLVDQGYMKEVTFSNGESKYTKAENYELIKKWMKIRTEDINFTLDTIKQYAAQAESTKLYQLIDSDRIGVFGHSMGAAASVQIGRERVDVDAVINIDGPYFSEMVYDAKVDEIVATREQYDMPILNIYSDQVWVQLQDGKETGVYAGNKISEQMGKENYDIYLKGTKHLTLTDLSIVSPFLTYLLNGQRAEVDAKDTIELENSLILEFFDATLKGIGEFTSAGVYE